MEKLLNVLLGVLTIIFISMICYFIMKYPNTNQSTYRIRFGDRIYYTKSIDTIPNGGIQFIDVRHDINVKIFGHYSVEGPKKNK